MSETLTNKPTENIKTTQESLNGIFRYTPLDLKSYDPERHISPEDMYKIIDDPSNSNIHSKKLKDALDTGTLPTFNHKGETYIDRLDVGRLYHDSNQDKIGLTIDRHFTDGNTNPYDSVKWEKRHAKILDYNNPGKFSFDMPDVEFPNSWTDNQLSIVAQKYFFKPEKEDWKTKVNNQIGSNNENSLKQLINRVTNFIADEGYKMGYFATEEDRNSFSDELKWLQVNRKLAFNSPVQFNAGIYNEYGIHGNPGIGYWRDPSTGELEKIEYGEFIHPQSHACFIKGPRDNLEAILQHVVDEGSVFSLGSGIGQDIGAIRAQGEPLSGGGTASGPISFLKVYDDGAGTIKSGGKSRRAARMTTMRYHHKDIMEFIRSKVNEDKKAYVLMQNGFEGGMDGEAVSTVTLQNTNISVRLDDHFFEQLKIDGDVELKYVKSGEVAETVSSIRMLKEIAFGSWRIGDPGVQYESKIQEMHTAKNSGRQNSTNPCSEYLFLNDTSCNLNSHNLAEYADSKGNFNPEDFARGVWLSSIAADILNDASSYPIKDIAIISPEFRTIGVGYAGIGKLLMRKGIPYDSDEGRALSGAIASLMTGATYEASIDMANKLGTFTHYEFNKQPMQEVMNKHKNNLENVLEEYIPTNLIQASKNSWNNVIEKGNLYGFRNAQATVLAPTGTISYLLGTEDSTGIEPALSLLVQKNLSGGGNIFIANNEVNNALHNLGYDEFEIKDIVEFINGIDHDGIGHGVIGAPHLSPDHYSVFDTSFGDSNGNGSIEFQGHIKMLGAVQPFISGAISKTNNLPGSATVKEIYDGFILGHELGLKAVAVFRDKSKPTQAVGFGDQNLLKLNRGEKEDLNFEGDSYRQEFKIDGEPFRIDIGEYSDGRPGDMVIESYTGDSTLGELLRVAGIGASKALKRGVELEDIVAPWIGRGFEPRGLVSVDRPTGSHPHIKTTLSPLDFMGRILLLHYKGRTEYATEPDKIDIKELRGFKNGAFKSYQKRMIDQWDIDEILNNPELGGFEDSISKNNIDKSVDNHTKKEHDRSVICKGCGNIMRQTSPGCFSCGNCGNSLGGCGL